MKLLIVLNSENFSKINFDEYDLILSKHKYSKIPEEKYINFYDIEALRKDWSDIYDLEYARVMNEINQDVHKLLVEANKVFIYRMSVEECCVWDKGISDLKDKISSVTIDEYSSISNFIPFYAAHNEINEQLFYKDSYLISQIIKQVCDSQNIKIKYLSKNNVLKQYFHIVVRRYGLFTLKFLLHIKNHFKYKSKIKAKDKIFKKVGDVNFFVSVRSIIHIDFVWDFLKINKNNSALHVGERQYAYGENAKFCSDNNFDNYSAEKSYNTFSDIFKIYFNGLFDIFLKPINNKISINYSNFSLPLNYLYPEVVISSMEHRMYYASQKRILKKVKKETDNVVVLSTEHFTPYAYWLNKVANEYNFKMVQIQISRLSAGVIFLNYVMGEYFLMYSSALAKQLQLDHPFFVDKITYKGFIKYINRIEIPKNDNFRKIIYFSQPYEYEFEDEILAFLEEYYKDKDVELYLKPHPRDDVSRFLKFKSFNVMKSNEVFRNYIQGFDLSITRMSTIAVDSVVLGVPVVYCLHSPSDKYIEADYIDNNYQNNSYEIEELRSILDNEKALVANFENYRDAYLKRNDTYYDNDKINDFFKKLING